MSARNREPLRLVRLCQRQGFRVRFTRKGYVVLGRSPDDPVVVIHKTPSDHRWQRNAVAELRKIGVQV